MMTKPELVEVNSIDHFIYILTEWHQAKVKVLEHMLSIPEGTKVTLDDSEPMTLEGDLHKGMLIGLNVALCELGVLPFIVNQNSQQEESLSTDEPIM